MVKIISSAEFRKSYAKLTEPTVVTVNGHPIGEWWPGPVQASVGLRPGEPTTGGLHPAAKAYRDATWNTDGSLKINARGQQAERDAILRKVNRGG